jgi:hypothetical protein
MGHVLRGADDLAILGGIPSYALAHFSCSRRKVTIPLPNRGLVRQEFIRNL